MFREQLTFDEHHCGCAGHASVAKVEEPVAGYGACSSSGCICQAYSGEGALCTNCAHSYEQHW